MATTILISDAGTFSRAEWDSEAYELKVTHSGGCDVERVLAGVDFDDDIQRVAQRVLADWQDGYDGDPSESGLRVEVTRSGESATASA